MLSLSPCLTCLAVLSKVGIIAVDDRRDDEVFQHAAYDHGAKVDIVIARQHEADDLAHGQ